jgi:hypothetical protein
LPDLTLDLCGRRFRIETDDARLVAGARRRYSAFACRGSAEASITLDVYRAAFGPFREEPRVLGDGRAWRVQRHDLDLETVPGLTRGAVLGTAAALDSVLRIVLSFDLLRRGGFLCHAAAVDGWLFPGVSGTGKSTLGDSAPKSRLLADELVGVTGTTLWGTPFRGDFKAGRTRVARPVEALVLLDRRAPQGIRRRPAAAALGMLMRCALCFATDAASGRTLLSAAARLARKAPAFELSYDARTTPFREVERMIRGALA